MKALNTNFQESRKFALTLPDTITFEVIGKVCGKQRHRSTRRGKMYTPEQTVNYESYLGFTYQSLKDKKWFDKDAQIGIAIDSYLSIPKRVSKKRKALMLSGKIRPTKKPDMDNIVKIVMDGLTGHAYPDDKQIVEFGRMGKFYTEREEKIIVSIWKV